MDNVTTNGREQRPVERREVVPGYGEYGGEERRQIRRTVELVAGGSAVEAVGGAGGVVLGILGLAGILPSVLLSVGVVCVAGALISQGMAVAARFRRIQEATAAGRRARDKAELGGGTGMELFGGIAGLALGILALVGVLPMTLNAIAAIVLGATVLMAAATINELNNISATAWHQHRRPDEIAREVTRGATGAQGFVGLGAIVLGILGLLGIAPMTLLLVSVIGLGGSVLLSGTAIAGRMVAVLRH